MSINYINIFRILLASSLFVVFGTAQAESTVTEGFTQKQQSSITPEGALKLLKQGNERFISNTPNIYDYKLIRKETANGQFPFAVILSCLDSRSSPNIIFDQGLGDIFVGRVAGNVIDRNMLGSMEFATKYAGAKLIVVVGHTDCGAIQGACENVGKDNLRLLLDTMKPAVKKVSKKEKGNCQEASFIDDIASQNVINQLNNIYKDSPTIKQMVDRNQLLLVGAMHNLATGKVDFFYKFDPKSSKRKVTSKITSEKE